MEDMVIVRIAYFFLLGNNLNVHCRRELIFFPLPPGSHRFLDFAFVVMTSKKIIDESLWLFLLSRCEHLSQKKLSTRFFFWTQNFV